MPPSVILASEAQSLHRASSPLLPPLLHYGIINCSILPCAFLSCPFHTVGLETHLRHCTLATLMYLNQKIATINQILYKAVANYRTE